MLHGCAVEQDISACQVTNGFLVKDDMFIDFTKKFTLEHPVRALPMKVHDWVMIIDLKVSSIFWQQETSQGFVSGL